MTLIVIVYFPLLGLNEQQLTDATCVPLRSTCATETSRCSSVLLINRRVNKTEPSGRGAHIHTCTSDVHISAHILALQLLSTCRPNQMPSMCVCVLFLLGFFTHAGKLVYFRLPWLLVNSAFRCLTSPIRQICLPSARQVKLPERTLLINLIPEINEEKNV